MPQYHKTIGKPAIFVAENKHGNHSIAIRSKDDMPPLKIWKMMRDFPPELTHQGESAVYAFLSAFWPKKDVFYINIFASGFDECDLDLIETLKE